MIGYNDFTKKGAENETTGNGIQNLLKKKTTHSNTCPPPTSTIRVSTHSYSFPPPHPIISNSSPFHQAHQAMRPQNPETQSTLGSKSKKPTDSAESDASFPSKNHESEQKPVATCQSRQPPPPPASSTRADGSSATTAEEGGCCGRERLKRHWVEVAGRVWIPDIWGQEDLLKDWIDCSAFDSSLVGSSIMSARASLVGEGRRASSTRFGIENSC